NICKPEDGGSQGGFCGDDTCDSDEDQASCCKDCGCTGGEFCDTGSNICKPDDSGSQGGFCGDNECNGEENSGNCCKDCGCTGGEYCEYESNICKPEDGGSQGGFCGDDTCDSDEDQASCCKDCGCTGGEYCEYESNICKPEDDGTDGGSTDGGPSGYKCCQSTEGMDACRVDLDQPCPGKYEDLPDEWVDPNAPGNCISPGPGMTDPPWCDMTSGGDPTGGDDHPDCYDAITDATCGELAGCQWCEGDSDPHSCFPDEYTCGSGGKV
ncbi:MAG: hypothetical protein QGG50_03975, partial [Methanopyri archaeon]|nr:hypothetical protein [Methanopyri archaeon]